jgi:ligand-binding SRPBCC domain-containing protein
MTTVQYQTDINALVEKVYEYYTNPNSIQEASLQDIVVVLYSKHGVFFVKNAAKISLSVICHLFF